MVANDNEETLPSLFETGSSQRMTGNLIYVTDDTVTESTGKLLVEEIIGKVS